MSIPDLFTWAMLENEEDKQYMSCDGSFKPIQERKKSRPSSHEEIALAILDNIYRRKFIKVLSGLGKLDYIMQRVSPQLVEWVLLKNMKKIQA